MTPERPASDPREADWVRLGAAGDRGALAAIVRAYQDRLYRFLLRLSRDPELALDLTQETFMRAFAALPGFRSGSSLSPWLLTIARRLFLDHVRATRPTEPLDTWESESHGAVDPVITALPETEAIEEALATLPLNWREAVVLRHYHDLEYETIAEILGVPIGTVKSWLFRGRERLREALATERSSG